MLLPDAEGDAVIFGQIWWYLVNEVWKVTIVLTKEGSVKPG